MGYNEGAIAPYHPLSYEISRRNREIRQSDAGHKDNALSGKHRRPSVPDYDPPFSPFWYSVDNFIPLVDLRQKDRWMPDLHSERAGLGWWLRLLVWGLTLLGWVLSSLVLAAVTGVIH